jgi:2-polyprenyl-3-methyl-5-hydroxy-6-metoxy-1,4-benzoquinol methylase
MPASKYHDESVMGKNKRKFDFEWDDGHLFPNVLYPDADFMLRRMNEATLEIVNPACGDVILDIGCGRGIDGVGLAKKGAVVVGLEPSHLMLKYASNYISENRANMSLIRGLGEYVPLRAQSMDKVVCKGALDHFPDPAMVMEQIALVLKPEGKAIIAIANFESLGFKLGRMMWWLRKNLGFKNTAGRRIWEVPEDHTYKLDYSSLRRLVDSCLEVEQARGVSLFFGLPWWGMLLAKVPRKISLAILRSLDRIAWYLPHLSDVVVLRCSLR